MSADERSTLEFFSQPGTMTSVGRFAAQVDALPRDVAGLATIGQGLLIHEHMVAAYGVSLTDDERSSVHVRRVADLLERVVARDDRPLDMARPPAARVAGNCRHFSVLMVAMLRAHGIPARARCGFGGYFRPGTFEDHWVCEYWNDAQQRWTLVDAQVDRPQRSFFSIDFDPTDVPRDQFLIAGDAWLQCRGGAADPGRFGLSFTDEFGYWWIAGNLMRDAAALGHLELLPWDVWGAMPGPDDTIGDDRFELFDRLAPLTLTPDTAFTELRAVCQDERLRVPPAIHNAVLARDEAL